MVNSEIGRINAEEAFKAKIDAVFAQRSTAASLSQAVQSARKHSPRSPEVSSKDATRTKVDGVFALRMSESNGLAKIDAIFGKSADATASSNNPEATSGAPRQERPTPAPTFGQAEPATVGNALASSLDSPTEAKVPQSVAAQPDLAQNDWTRMTSADVSATAAYAVSLLRDAYQATPFLMKRAASSAAFREALAPEGLELGETITDRCEAAVNAALAERGWS